MEEDVEAEEQQQAGKGVLAAAAAAAVGPQEMPLGATASARSDIPTSSFEASPNSGSSASAGSFPSAFRRFGDPSSAAQQEQQQQQQQLLLQAQDQKQGGAGSAMSSSGVSGVPTLTKVTTQLVSTYQVCIGEWGGGRGSCGVSG